MISVYADLVQYRITTEYGGNIAREEQYNSLDEMNELALKYLSFDDLISLSDEEKGLEVRHDVAVEAELRGVHASFGLRQQQRPVVALRLKIKFVLIAVRGRNAPEFRGSKKLTDRNSVALQNSEKLECFVPVLVFDGGA